MKLGSNDISAVKIGSTDVNKIYIGSTEVWGRSIIFNEFNKRVTDDGGVTEAEICFTNAVLDLQRLNAWNDASLVMIPSGYKDGTLYSVKPTNGDGDFTFSRGSNLSATRVNSEGLIERVGRICYCSRIRLILLGVR